MRSRSRGPTVFSKRERVGWEARSRGESGSRPSSILRTAIGAQAVGVVAVEVAEGDAEDALAQHVGEGMLDAGTEAGVAEAGDEGTR